MDQGFGGSRRGNRRLSLEILEEREMLTTADYAAHVVLFSPAGSRSDRGPTMFAAAELVQEQWESWGWTFQLEDTFEIVNAPLGAPAYNDFFDIYNETVSQLQSQGVFNPTANYLIFAEDTIVAGAAAQANSEAAIFYDFIVEGIVNGAAAEIGNIGHEMGHVVGLGHENCSGTEFFNRPTQTRGPECNAAGWPDALFPPAWQFPIVEHESSNDIAEYGGGYELPITFLSDLPWVSATVGSGTIQRDLSFSGNVLELNNNPWGAGYAKGIGTLSNSTITYDLAGGYERFQSSVGIDDFVGNSGSVVFQVFADGSQIYNSGLVFGFNTSEYIDLDVSGVNQLQLVVTDGGNGNSNDHANWANARLIGSAYPDFSLTGLGQTIVDDDTTPTGLDGTDFGTGSLGATGPTSTFVLSNTGAVRGTVADIKLPKGFQLVSAPTFVDPGQSISIEIQLETIVPGEKAGFVELTTNGLGTEKKYSFEIQGEVVGGNPTTTFVSDIITPANATNGFGPIELDRSNGGSGAFDGGFITLQGQRYTKGIGAHAAGNGATQAEIVVALNSQYDWFLSDVGIDDEVGSSGSVTFQVVTNTGLVYEVGPLFGDSPTESFEVPVTGVDTLFLRLDPANGGGGANSSDHADWANARLITVTDPNADFDGDGLVTGTDFLAWQAGFGTGSTLAEGDANSDSQVDSADLGVWEAQYGQQVSATSSSAVGSGPTTPETVGSATDLGSSSSIDSPSVDLRGIGGLRSSVAFGPEIDGAGIPTVEEASSSPGYTSESGAIAQQPLTSSNPVVQTLPDSTSLDPGFSEPTEQEEQELALDQFYEEFGNSIS